ncbi:galactitol-1-phosphate 5-dehydrogenase [Butyrivibrio sp. FCS014]|uniref:galactitol-1-phosphate 5-dehydrogenase n=1 Tax=Butyrivibrio sp. FCS014 TaxID=1408304 RepID=UPI000463DE00|nr:galactitol-1-phosphate 5-dehydrogenase [Butyrivibrio sp. FCS014]
MKAQILYGINDIKYTDIAGPVPGEDEALIKVNRCGICGSDVPRIYTTGAHNMPLIPGHEMSGTIVECPARPDLLGKRAGIFPLIPCKKCSQCKARHYEMCEHYDYLGSRSDGGFAEYVKVPLWNLLPIPDEVADDDAAMLEPMCVAVHAIRMIGLAGADDAADYEARYSAGADAPAPSIAVCGLGTIGLLVALFLRDAGYRNVFCLGNKDVQRDKLLAMGYEPSHFIDIRVSDPVAAIMEKTGGRGVEVYFECIGRSVNYEQAVNLTAPLGRIMLVGNPASDMSLPREVYWKILRHQLTLRGTWNSAFYGIDGADDDWRYALGRLVDWSRHSAADEKEPCDGESCSTGGFLPGGLITHRFSLADMKKGLEIMRTKSEEYVKVMVEM